MIHAISQACWVLGNIIYGDDSWDWAKLCKPRVGKWWKQAEVNAKSTNATQMITATQLYCVYKGFTVLWAAWLLQRHVVFAQFIGSYFEIKHWRQPHLLQTKQTKTIQGTVPICQQFEWDSQVSKMVKSSYHVRQSFFSRKGVNFPHLQFILVESRTWKSIEGGLICMEFAWSSCDHVRFHW